MSGELGEDPRFMSVVIVGDNDDLLSKGLIDVGLIIILNSSEFPVSNGLKTLPVVT